MDNINKLIRNNVKNIKPYSSARDEFTEEVNDFIFIDANENPFQTAVNRYPDPQHKELKQVLGIRKNISVDNILLGNGSDEVLDLLFRAFCEPGEDNVVILPPTYGMYEVLANINNVSVIKANLSDVFQPSVEVILNAATVKSKILFLCSPNNPTGNSFNAKYIEQLIEKFNGLVVLDEAYIDFSQQNSWLGKLKDYQNLVITQTFSKAYGLAGIRLGVCYASKEIIKILNTIKPPYNVNSLTQMVAIERLQKHNLVSEEIKLIISERKRLEVELNTISFIDEVYASDANFLLIKVDNANKRYQEIIEKGIVVRNRSNQALCDNCLRISIGTKAENDKLITILEEIE